MRPPLASPYPGLRPFHKHEWPIFFGREPMIDAVLDRLAETQLVVVHGSSGCGKSSLIKAGVLPRLEQEHSRYGVPWRTAEMRPGSSPLWNLATAIARLHEKLEGDAEPTLETTRTVRRLLNGGRDALGRVRERYGLGKDGNVCLLLDQFEELFRYAREIGREEAEALIEVLRGFEPGGDGGGQGPPQGLYAILTMRSDHLGDCGHFDGFAELVNATQYLLPRIRDDALLRAIREPARLFGGEVAPDLAIRLVDESRLEIDGLPLVQHALMRLWRLTAGAPDNPSWPRPSPMTALSPVLTSKGYSGLAALLSEHAEEVLADATTKDPQSAKVAEYLFRAITEVDAEGRGIRRPQRLSQLVGVTGGNRMVLEQVVERFSRPDCGFLVRSPGDDPMIDIGHEALIRCWKRLSDPTVDSLTGRPLGWLPRERDDGQVWRALVVTIDHEFLKHSTILKWFTTVPIIRGLLDSRLDWFDDLPGDKWSDRHGGAWTLVSNFMDLARRLRRSHILEKRVSIGIVVLSLIYMVLFYIAMLSKLSSNIIPILTIAMVVMTFLFMTMIIVNLLRLRRHYIRCFASNEMPSLGSGNQISRGPSLAAGSSNDPRSMP